MGMRASAIRESVKLIDEICDSEFCAKLKPIALDISLRGSRNGQDPARRNYLLVINVYLWSLDSAVNVNLAFDDASNMRIPSKAYVT